jgi:hypothetical protein
LATVDHIPYCHFKSSEEDETCGLDETECGELCYDYVTLNRDLEGNYSPNDTNSRDGKDNGVGVSVTETNNHGPNAQILSEKKDLANNGGHHSTAGDIERAAPRTAIVDP